MKQTKIICTIGPATESEEMLRKLYNAGMNIARLNMSHGKHEWLEQIIGRIKKLNKELPLPIGILLDTQGPEIRTGDIEGTLELKENQIVLFAVEGSEHYSDAIFHIHYADLIPTMRIGDIMKVDNGLINLEVVEKDENNQFMRCKVLDGGPIKSKRHVNLPGLRVNLPSITSKDKDDISFGVKNGIDFIALSFVREGSDVKELRKLLEELPGKDNNKIKIISKIENHEGVDNFDEILEESDGVMIARGDLGVEIDNTDLPHVQRKLVRKASEKGKRVVVATHMLESMISAPIPTRAEVTDVSNAVLEEVDAVMLSGETTVGKYPIRCVEQMSRIAEKAEAQPGLRMADNLIAATDRQSLAISAVNLSKTLSDIKGIVVITRRGVTAELIANVRPQGTKIYAFTSSRKVQQTLTLTRGVLPFCIGFSDDDTEITVQTALNILKGLDEFSAGDKVVMVSDVLTQNQWVDAIQIRFIP